MITNHHRFLASVSRSFHRLSLVVVVSLSLFFAYPAQAVTPGGGGSDDICLTPVSLRSAAGINSVELSWQAVAGAMGYTVEYRSLNETTWHSVNTSSNSLVINGLPTNATYFWRVKTRCSGSESVWTNNQYFKTIYVIQQSNGVGEGLLFSIAPYPVPSTGAIMLNVVTVSNEPTYLSVFNAAGQLVAAQTVDSQEAALDLSAQPNGVYLIKALHNGQTSSARVIIAK